MYGKKKLCVSIHTPIVLYSGVVSNVSSLYRQKLHP